MCPLCIATTMTIVAAGTTSVAGVGLVFAKRLRAKAHRADAVRAAPQTHLHEAVTVSGALGTARTAAHAAVRVSTLPSTA